MPSRRGRARAEMGPFVARILVIRLSALGDVVLVEPVVRALRSRLPGVQLDLVTDARYATWARRAMGFDHVVGYDRRGEDAGWAGTSAVLGRLPAPRYDVVVDLQGKLRTRALAWRVPARRHLTLQKRSLAEGVLALFGRDPPLADRHTTDLYLSVLRPLGVDPAKADRRPRLAPPPAALRRPGFRIGLAPGATHATKRWPAERFGALAEHLFEGLHEAEFVLVGGPEDRPLFEAILAATRAPFDPLDVASQDVEGLSRTLASLDLLVSVDTGPAHLAAALGVPVVVLFGPTSPVRWGPIGPDHRAVSLGLPCAPCSNTGGPGCPDPARAHACMRDLGVAQVIDAVYGVLEEERR